MPTRCRGLEDARTCDSRSLLPAFGDRRRRPLFCHALRKPGQGLVHCRVYCPQPDPRPDSHSALSRTRLAFDALPRTLPPPSLSALVAVAAHPATLHATATDPAFEWQYLSFSLALPTAHLIRSFPSPIPSLPVPARSSSFTLYVIHLMRVFPLPTLNAPDNLPLTLLPDPCLH